MACHRGINRALSFLAHAARAVYPPVMCALGTIAIVLALLALRDGDVPSLAAIYAIPCHATPCQN